MQRRTFLGTGGVALSALLGGCTYDEMEEIDGGTRDDGTASGSSALEIVDHGFVVDDEEWSTDVYVEATVENTGTDPSSDVKLQVDWYDEDGNYLDNDTGRLTSLGDGETWAARIYHISSDSEAVADYELEGEFSDDVYESAPDLTVLESGMEAGDDDLLVEGRVENESGEKRDYLEVAAKIYDGEGNVLGDEWTNVTDLRAGDTWAFTCDYFPRGVRNRADEAADHEILVKDTL